MKQQEEQEREKDRKEKRKTHQSQRVCIFLATLSTQAPLMCKGVEEVGLTRAKSCGDDTHHICADQMIGLFSKNIIKAYSCLNVR